MNFAAFHGPDATGNVTLAPGCGTIATGDEPAADCTAFAALGRPVDARGSAPVADGNAIIAPRNALVAPGNARIAPRNATMGIGNGMVGRRHDVIATGIVILAPGDGVLAARTLAIALRHAVVDRGIVVHATGNDRFAPVDDPVAGRRVSGATGNVISADRNAIDGPFPRNKCMVRRGLSVLLPHLVGCRRRTLDPPTLGADRCQNTPSPSATRSSPYKRSSTNTATTSRPQSFRSPADCWTRR